MKLSRIVIAGLGKPRSCINVESAANAIGATVAAKLLTNETTVTFAVSAAKRAKVSDGDFAAHIAFGAQMRSYG